MVILLKISPGWKSYPICTNCCHVFSTVAVFDLEGRNGEDRGDCCLQDQ